MGAASAPTSHRQPSWSSRVPFACALVLLATVRYAAGATHRGHLSEAGGQQDHTSIVLWCQGNEKLASYNYQLNINQVAQGCQAYGLTLPVTPSGSPLWLLTSVALHIGAAQA